MKQRTCWQLIGAISVLAVPSAANADIDFAPRVNVPTAGNPTWLTAADLNGDGIADLAVTHAPSGVAVHRGLGSGQYAPPTVITVGSDPFGIVAADLNGDTKVDLAVTNSGSRTVSILIGDGAGAFTSAAAVPVGALPGSISAGDVNADAKVDLVVMNLESLNASLLLGNGDGTFAASFLSVGPFGFGSAIGDVTGDGQPDLITTGEGIRVHPGPVPTSPAPPFQIGGKIMPFQAALADFNRDGRLDIATANLASYDVSLVLNQGGNVFAAPLTYPASALPSAIAVGDVNADGALDVAVTNLLSGDVSVLEGTGLGTFRAAKQFRVGLFPQGLAVTDLTGDGRADLLVSNGDGSVSVLISRPLAPGTTGSAKLRTACRTPRRVVAGESIGCIAIGMSRAQVREILGPPRSIRRDRRTKDTLFGYGGVFVDFDGQSNSVDLVWTTRPGYKLPNGLGIGSSARLVKKRFPRAECGTSDGVQFCTVPRGRQTFTAFVIKGGVITEIDVGTQEG